jgi:hypothetical protein
MKITEKWVDYVKLKHHTTMTFKFQILKVMLERPETLFHASAMLEIIGEEKANAMAILAQQSAIENGMVTICKAKVFFQKALFSILAYGEGDKKNFKKKAKGKDRTVYYIVTNDPFERFNEDN